MIESNNTKQPAKKVNVVKKTRGNKPLILIVEDNEILSKNLSRYLEMKGFSADRVISVELAKQKMKEKDYHMLILDINLP